MTTSLSLSGKRSSAAVWVIVGVWAVAMALPGIQHGLWRPDEARVAGICAEMARTGDILVPSLNGQPFMEKPPLYFITASLFARIFGQDHDLSYRLASLFFGAIAIIFTAKAATVRMGRRGGFIAAAILASTWLFFRVARWIQVDSALVAFSAMALFAYLAAMRTPKFRYSILLGLALGGAFMVKGFIGPVLIGAGIFFDLVRLRSFPALWSIRPFLVAGVAAVPVVVWAIALYARGGDSFLHEVIVVNNIGRLIGTKAGAALGHQHGVMYYAQRMPMDFLPWTLIVICAFIRSIARMKKDRYLLLVVAPMIILCLASTKRNVYILPLYPALACMVTQWLMRYRKARWEIWSIRCTWVIVVGLCIAPLSGIALGYMFVGIVAGGAGAGVVLALAWRRRLRGAFTLALAGTVGIAATGVLFFRCRQADKDLLRPTRAVLSGVRNVTVVQPSESLSGMLSFVCKRRVPKIEKLEEVVSPGTYVCVGGDDVLSELQTRFSVRLLAHRPFASAKLMIIELTPRKRLSQTLFRPGETLAYKLLWAEVPVGTMAVTASRAKPDTGWQFTLQCKTNTFADKIYKVRLNIQSRTDADMTRSFAYICDKIEGRSIKKQTFLFDWDGMRVHYQKNDAEDLGWTQLEHLCLDPLTLFYAIRTYPNPRVGSEWRGWVSDGKAAAEAYARIVAQENLWIGENVYETFVWEADTKDLQGVFKKTRDSTLKLWVAKSSPYMPIKISSKVQVGSFSALFDPSASQMEVKD